MTNWTILGIPIDSSGKRTGVERMPDALRTAGLTELLDAQDRGDLPVAIDDPQRDPATGMIGFGAVCTASSAIQAAVTDMLAAGERPLLIGGCCTLLIGVAAALKTQVGSVGLAFVDGHLDFYDGHSSPTGEAADMELAILTGHGPGGLIDLVGAPPLLDPAHIVALGYRDERKAELDGAPDPNELTPQMTRYSVYDVRREGFVSLGYEIAERFADTPGRFWLHLDLDVLDQEVMSAVDYPMLEGLAWDELRALIYPLAQSSALIGMDVTIYNPLLDPVNQYPRQINIFLQSILS